MVVLVLAALLLNQQPTAELSTEMARVFKGLVEIAQPSNIEVIRTAMVGPGPIAESWERVNGGKMWGYGAGMSLVHFTDRNDFRAFSTVFPNQTACGRSDEDLRNEALQAVDLIGFWGETRSANVERKASSGVTVQVTAYFGDMASTHDATVRFATGSLALESVFMWDRLDYARFRNAPRVTRQAAKLAAIEAYEAFAPYAVAQVGTVRPFFGIPASAEIRPPAWHEMSPELLALCRQFVALPLYYVDFTDLSGTSNVFGGSNLTVVVDAMSGKAIVIYPNTERSNSKPPAKLNPFARRLEVSLPSGETGTLRQAEAGPAVGHAIGLGIDGMRVQARFDPKSGLVFLPDGQDWRAYRPDRRLDARLRRPTVQRKPFGGGPNQPYRPGVG